jgi:hypothetical protein
MIAITQDTSLDSRTAEATIAARAPVIKSARTA